MCFQTNVNKVTEWFCGKGKNNKKVKRTPACSSMYKNMIITWKKHCNTHNKKLQNKVNVYTTSVSSLQQKLMSFNLLSVSWYWITSIQLHPNVLTSLTLPSLGSAGDSNENKPLVGAEDEEVAKMGCPSLGEHTQVEVVIEESYEFKVSRFLLHIFPFTGNLVL